MAAGMIQGRCRFPGTRRWRYRHRRIRLQPGGALVALMIGSLVLTLHLLAYAALSICCFEKRTLPCRGRASAFVTRPAYCDFAALDRAAVSWSLPFVGLTGAIYF